MTQRFFAVLASLVLATGCTGNTNNDDVDTDTVHTGETDDTTLPVNSQLEVIVTKLGVPEDCVATINDGDGTEITKPSGTVNEVHAGTWTVTAGSSPFNSKGDPTHTDTDGVSWIGPKLETAVADEESVTVEVALNRYLKATDRYHCVHHEYFYDEDLQGPAPDSNYDYDHGYFSLETLEDGTLAIYTENGTPASDEIANSSKYMVRGNSLILTGDEDGLYPERLESSTISPNGDITWLVARPLDMYPLDDYVPNDYVEFVCTVE